MRALARLGPRRGVQPFLDRGLHQRMIGGVEAHEVDPAAVAVVGVEFGRVLVGERAQFEPFGRSGMRAEGAERVRGPVRALAPHRLLQRGVGIVEVVVGEFDRLVDHLMGDGPVRVEPGARKLSCRSGVMRFPCGRIKACRDCPKPRFRGLRTGRAGAHERPVEMSGSRDLLGRAWGASPLTRCDPMTGLPDPCDPRPPRSGGGAVARPRRRGPLCRGTGDADRRGERAAAPRAARRRAARDRGAPWRGRDRL